MEEIKRWLRVERLGEDAFPRQVSLRRVAAKNLDEMMQYVNECRNAFADCYASVFSLPQIESKKFDTLFIDVDGDRGTFEAIRMVLGRYGIKPRTYFSGRGYHLYCDFESAVFKDYKNSSRTFLRLVLGELYKMVDASCIGDVMRMARVPNTVNTKSGRKMELIDAGRLNDMSRLLEMDDKFDSMVQEKVKPFRVEMEYPPCISVGIEMLKKTRKLDHQARLHLASFLIHVMDVDEVIKVFSVAEDFDEEYTTYQVMWLIENNYLPYACRNVKNMGLCPVGRCRYYPWMYVSMLRMMEAGR